MVSPNNAILRSDLAFSMNEFDVMGNAKGYVGLPVLPPIITGQQNGIFSKVPPGQLLSVHQDTTRAAGTAYKRDEFEFDTGRFETSEHGTEEILDDRQVALYSDLVSAENVAITRAVGKIAQSLELDCVELLTDSSTWSGSDLATTVSTPWDDHLNCNPQEDVAAAKEKIVSSTGLIPNTLIISREAFDHLSFSYILVGLLRVDEIRIITTEHLRLAFGVENVIIATAVKNTASRGQTPSFESVWPRDLAMLCRVSSDADPSMPCLGRTFCWGNEVGGFTDEHIFGIVEEYREEQVRGSVFRCRSDWQPQILFPECAHHIKGVLTAAE